LSIGNVMRSTTKREIGPENGPTMSWSADDEHAASNATNRTERICGAAASKPRASACSRDVDGLAEHAPRFVDESLTAMSHARLRYD
jgi:hypothetical protein